MLQMYCMLRPPASGAASSTAALSIGRVVSSNGNADGSKSFHVMFVFVPYWTSIWHSAEPALLIPRFQRSSRLLLPPPLLPGEVSVAFTIDASGCEGFGGFLLVETGPDISEYALCFIPSRKGSDLLSE